MDGSWVFRTTSMRGNRSVLLESLVVLATTALALGGGNSNGWAAGPEGVRRYRVRPNVVSYFEGAAWLPGEDELLVLDPRQGRLLVMSRADGAAREVRSLGGDAPPLSLARALFPVGGLPHVVFEDWEHHQTWELTLDEKLHVRERFGWHTLSLNPEGHVAAMRRSVRVGERYVLQAGVQAGSTFRDGVIVINAQPPHRFEWVAEYRVHTGAVVMLHPHTLLAEAQGGVFFLDVGGAKPAIHQLLPTRRKLAALPQGFSNPPDAPAHLQALDAALAHTAALEKAATPAGLFSRGGFLLLLTRQPTKDGQTQWRLHRLDPKADRLVGTLVLPTTAPELLVAPGAKRWALVELGPVQGALERPLEAWVELPAALLDGSWPSP